MKLIVIGMLTLVTGYAVIWNVNSLLALNVQIGETYDPLLWKIDLALYSWLMRREVSMEGLFPLVKNQTIFVLLESAYFTLIPEIILVFLLSVQKGEKKVVSFFIRLYTGYLIAFVCFYLFPTIGPCSTLSSMHIDYRGTPTYGLLEGTVMGFNAIKQGILQGGVAYFIALPSMHVAVATFLQTQLRPNLLLFWIFLPINTLVIISTFVLGYHYFLDIPAGIIVAMLVLLPGKWLAFCKMYQKNTPKLAEESLNTVSASKAYAEL